MSKKQLKRDLELKLVKTIEDLLISINPEATKKVDDIIFGAAKILAKKFYKSAKPAEEKKQEKVKTTVAKKSPKKVAKKASKPVAEKSKNKK